MPNKEDTLAKITKRTDTRLAKHISSDAAKLNNAITTLEKRIIAKVNSLSTGDNGNLVGPKVNLKQAQKIHTSLVKVFEDTYGAAALQTVDGFSNANDWVVENFSDLGVSATFTDFDETMINQLNNQSILNFANIGNDARARVEKALYQSIAAQVPMETLIGEISAALTGLYATNGRPLSTYAELYANDGLMNYYNSVSIEKGRQLGMEKFYYSGTVMGNTRDFCRSRVGKVYTTEEINSWTYNWAGKSGPAMTNRGGWNCRHHWQPVEDEWIDDPSKVMGKSWEAMSIDERLSVMKARGMAMSPDEKLFKKRLNQLRYNLKSGKGFKADSNLGKMWYNIPPDERTKLLTTWTDAGLDIPKAMWDDVIMDMPPANFVKIPGTIVPDAPPPIKKPPKVKPPPQTPPPVSTPPPPLEPDADIIIEGFDWNDLSKAQKKDMGQMGYNWKVGKKYNPNSKVAKTWNEMSYSAQQMKLKGWKEKGFTIPSNLPIKGAGNTAANIIDNAVGVVDDAPTFSWQTATFDEMDTAFKQKFAFKDGIQQLGYNTQAEIDVMFRELGQHWDDMVQRHPKLGGIINWSEQVKTGKQVVVSNSKVVGNGAAGVYGDQSHVLELAGKLSKNGTISVGKGGWSVGGDFYTVSRHEFGHYIDNTIRHMQDWPSKTSTKMLGWNHQSEFRALYKKHADQWETLFGSYSTKDKYEGFAEVFATYTSPDYKAGMMPKDIEDYMVKLLGGKVKVKLPPKPKSIKTAKLFANPDHQTMYDDMYAHYRQMGFSEAELQNELKEKCPAVFEALRSWQGSTQSSYPSALKLKAELLEARDDIKFFARKGVTFDMDRLKKTATIDIPDEEYIRIRAFNQEYFARTNTKAVTLKRGTDGQNSGPKFRSQVNKVKSEYPKEEWGKIDVTIREPALNGWSSSLTVADNFGANGRGITCTTKIPVEDIFCSDKLWPKYNYKGEKEWIIIRSEKQAYKLKDISSGFSSAEATAAKAKKAAKATPASWKPPQKVVDAIDALPSKIEEPSTAVNLYIQKIPMWQTQDAEYITDKLHKKMMAIQNAIDTGEPAYIFPGKLVNDVAVDAMHDAIKTIQATEGHMQWVNAVLENDFKLFAGKSLDPTTVGKALSKTQYNIMNDASLLPEFVSNDEQLKTLSVKLLDSYDWKNVSYTSELKDMLGTDILMIDSAVGNVKVLGHTVAGDVKDDFVKMLTTMEQNITVANNEIYNKKELTEMILNTKLSYY